MTRALGLVLAAVGALVGALCLVLAADLARVESELAADDTRFHARPAAAGYWDTDTLLPSKLATTVAGLDDDLAHRRAVQAFWRSGPRRPVEERKRLVAQRALAQQLLTELEGFAPTPERRSQIANLRGVLALVATADEGDRRALAVAAADNFARAILRDPGNEDAKFNLEVALKNSGNTVGSGEGTGGSGSRKGTEFGGSAVSGAGAGY